VLERLLVWCDLIATYQHPTASLQIKYIVKDDVLSPSQ
jgi:hypothetical protein